MKPEGAPATLAAVTIGEVMGLFVAEADTPLASAKTFDLQFAGAEATVAVGLSRLGHRVAYVGRVGGDHLGQRIIRDLRGHGVAVDHLRAVNGSYTGLLVRDSTSDRPISVLYYRAGSAASDLSVDDLPSQEIRDARILHITGITAALSASAHAALEHAAQIARSAGTTVVFDPNVRRKLAGPDRWREIIESLTPWADIVLTGADEARLVTAGDPASWFLDRGVARVVVKDGAHGAWESDGSTIIREGIRPTRTIDTVGAGDAFAAGWIDGWLHGIPPQQRLHRAATVASLCVGARGDTPGLPDADTLTQVLQDSEDVDR